MKRAILLFSFLLLTFTWANTTSASDCITRSELIQKIDNNEDVTGVNTGCITDMSRLFFHNSEFNQDISSWDVSQVTTMYRMFEGASHFNQDISSWDVSQVTNMYTMFHYASRFNQSLGDWNVSKVTNMSYMFDHAVDFNQDISAWDISSVTKHSLFEEASALQDSYNPFKKYFNIALQAEGMMIEYTVFSSLVDVETVRDSILAVIGETQGWSVPKMYADIGGYENLQQSLEDKHFPITRKVFIIGVCNGGAAQQTTNNLPSVTAMMPCRISVYEDDGKVKVSMMNATLPAFSAIADAMKGMIECGIIKAVQLKAVQ